MGGWLGRVAIGATLVFAAAAASAQTFSGALSGSWWDPARSGEGQFITFETIGDRNVAYLAYFTYSADGKATWHVGNADYAPGATSITIPVYTGSGARFGAAFNAADVRTTLAGTATIDFVSCTRLRLRHTANPGATLELERLVGSLINAGCGASPPPTNALTGNVSGSWWNAARGGEGSFITFETLGARSVAYIAYFTYTDDGQPTWLVGTADFAAGARSVSIPVFTGSGARFGAAFRAPDVVIASRGTVTLSFVSCSAMRMSYSGSTAFSLDLTRLVGPLSGGIACREASTAPPSQFDAQLRSLINAAGLTGNARAGRAIPSIDEPLPQLGKLLFFSKALSGNLDTACASCHHPSLGGSDGVSLSVGTGATNPNVVGPGRALPGGGFSVARNSNTFFNVALNDTGLFWDSRVESLGKGAGANGAGSGIRTPDSPFGVADSAAGPNLPAAQARFPVVSVKEMKGATAFAGLSDANVRAHIAARIGNYGSGSGTLKASQWLAKFRTAFNQPGGTAESLITFENIARAIAEYERSATFTDHPFARYVAGDNGAISEEAKQGALRFFLPVTEGGGQCIACHKGDRFTDERHTIAAFPQIGPGMGDGPNGTDDFGRERVTGNAAHRYLVRTPSLLNVEVTAPYGHTGAYGGLENSVRHYIIPEDNIDTFVRNRSWCSMPGFNSTPGCAATQVAVGTHTNLAMAVVTRLRNAGSDEAMPLVDFNQFNPTVGASVATFMRTLTDPCVKDRACLARWIPRPEEAPDEHQLNATDFQGNPL